MKDQLMQTRDHKEKNFIKLNLKTEFLLALDHINNEIEDRDYNIESCEEELKKATTQSEKDYWIESIQNWNNQKEEVLLKYKEVESMMNSILNSR